MSATTTDRSNEGHAEAAGSVESHIGSPPPSLVVLHPGAPQRHSQIRRSIRRVRDGPPWFLLGGRLCVMILVDGLIVDRVAVSVAVNSSIMQTRVDDHRTASVRGRRCCPHCAPKLLPHKGRQCRSSLVATSDFPGGRSRGVASYSASIRVASNFASRRTWSHSRAHWRPYGGIADVHERRRSAAADTKKLRPAGFHGT